MTTMHRVTTYAHRLRAGDQFYDGHVILTVREDARRLRDGRVSVPVNGRRTPLVFNPLARVTLHG